MAFDVAPAWGHPGHGSHQLAANAAQRAAATAAVLGEDAERTKNGLIRLETPAGERFKTHGPDFREYAAAQPGFRSGDPERPPACATDYYQHILYAHPLGALPGDSATQIAEVRAIVRRMNAVLNADSLESGGPSADYKVLCDGSGRIRVDVLPVPALDFSTIINTARAIGFADGRADYTIFLDAINAGWCGIATYVGDESPGTGNSNNSGGGYAAIERGCWKTTAPMHENGHNQGAVQYNSPSSTGFGAHCSVDYDVMCYSPDGGDLRQSGTTVKCADRVHFDCGFDDYFDSAPEPGEYLASHWNVGSLANRFIRFSEPTGTEPPPATGLPGDEGSVPRVDEVAPKARFVRKPPRKVKSRGLVHRVRFKFSASEDDVKYRCRADRARFRSCRSPHNAWLAKGWHVFRVRAVDAAGNRSKIARAKFKVIRKRKRR